jgi:hypothetical protein
MHIQIIVNGVPVKGMAYQAGEGVIIHIPAFAQKTGEEPSIFPPFKDLFQPVSSGFIEVGEWDGKAYEFEGSVELALGPDGKVWAKVCEPTDLPSAEPLPGTSTILCPKCNTGSTLSEENVTGQCSLCWGTGVIPSWDPWQAGDIVYALGYWSCKCDQNHIHPHNHDHCSICGAVAEEQPASRAEEVRLFLAGWGLSPM